MILRNARPWMLLAVFSLILHLHAVAAQNPHTPAKTAEDVMARVKANVKQYGDTIASFVCEESVDSTITANGKIKEQMKVLDSLEVERAGKANDFKETRIFTLVDGKKPRNQKVRPPYSFTGGFASLVGAAVDPCSDFSFAADSPQDGKQPYVLVSHPRAKTATLPSFCGNEFHAKHQPRTTISVDPQSFQISRLEVSVENVSFSGVIAAAAHLPFVPFPTPPDEMRTIVDYGSARVGEKIFNLPTSLTSTFTGVKRGKPLVLAYRAQYSNYHRFASSATMVPQ